MNTFNIHIHVHVTPSDFYPTIRNGRTTLLYNVYQSMLNRCSNPKHRYWHRYGGRGIIVCPEWANDFQAFARWAKANGYEIGLELDRINNNSNYQPDNCRFITCQENQQNRAKGASTNFGKHTRKPVVCIETGEEYASASEASKKLGVYRTGVATAIHLKQKCQGLTFKYK